ncbi:RES family NAD+ phosphorylase [Streptomyces sp. NBC_00820]|uniref:RES domain-containing protein n=1 Tax=Streptomyces sp. NBC_00820 TaxID=2975842 RepID=UPI002ED298BB|nr:RES family NAD+ phosphorylase [Streptomyces sp. NBC_00820]
MSQETYPEVRLVPAPERGVWHLGKAKDPLRYNQIAADDADRSSGNRWSLVSDGTLYCASEFEGCFAEALAPFRVAHELRDVIKDDWLKPSYMPPGHLPRDWRTRHTLVRLMPDKDARFLDVDDEDTLCGIQRALEPTLAELDIEKLTHEHIQGSDRRITRTIAAWAVAQQNREQRPLISGIVYRSRFAARECWAVFQSTELAEVESQPIWPETEGLRTVAEEYGLTIR